MTNLEMNRNIADFLGSYCSKWNISVSKFAEKCNIPYMTMKRIMACNVQKIDVYTITKIAQATRSPIMEILGVDRENLELYKRISYASAYDREIITDVLNILEKLHISGKETRQIPYVNLSYDRKSYLLDTSYFCSNQLNYSKMEKTAFRSTFSPGLTYCGFRLPNNYMHPCYLKGMILLAAITEPLDNEIGIFAWKEEGYIRLIFRRVQENGRYTELIPVNNRGRKYIIDNENVSDLMNWVKIGTVAGIIQ